ncbi:related to ALG11 - required for asparagine-linked glycosylation [Ustilago sp. UG-2017a]|nr:related to ALG11 - required for asparagine-linked glycosylation [Ustilago sp. UG-2017a]
MDRLLNLQTALSLGYVGSMIAAAHLSSHLLLPPTSWRKTRLAYLWLAFDAICNLTLEASFLYLSTQPRTVNASPSFFGYLWQEYAAAGKRWGSADPALVAMGFISVLIAGPLAGYCASLLAKGDKTYHYWLVVLSADELCGGWATFPPGWLAGSGELETGDWLLLRVYLVVMKMVWVVVPLWLMADSYVFVAQSLSESGVVDATMGMGVVTRKSPRKSSAAAKQQQQTGTITEAITSSRGISGSAYFLVLATIFLYIMPSGASASSTPTSSGYDPDGSTILFAPRNNTTSPSLLSTLRGILTPILLPLFLITFSITVGAMQVADKAIRRVTRTNRTRRRKLLSSHNISEKDSPKRTIIGFFHPYCNAGGGGERVLYEAISLHLSLDPNVVVVIYTGDFPAASKEQILAKASARFGISIDSNRITLIPLVRRWMVQDTAWSCFTLLGQSYGSVWLAFEAMSQLVPDVWVDTMGYAFTYPVVGLFDRKLPIGTYVHYPVISTDMLTRVAKREAGHTNDASTANSRLRSTVKLIYYRIFALLYSWALGRADKVVANGSWTQNHLNQLLGRKKGKEQVSVVYPPCDTSQLSTYSLERRKCTIVSLAQFRPEKEHPTQLRILAHLKSTHPELFATENSGDSSRSTPPVKLLIMGSSRNTEDERRISLLRSLSANLGLDKDVEFIVNATWSAVTERLGDASVGLSTMKDEHFGINVVEFMAAGLLTLSHKSAGPWLDIVFPSINHPVDSGGERSATSHNGSEEDGPGKNGEAPNGESKSGQEARGLGYHAQSVEEYASILATIFSQSQAELMPVREAARKRAQTVFGREAFATAWQNEVWSALELKLNRNRNRSDASREKAE